MIKVDDIDRLLIFILDLETTGTHRIVEIAAVQAHGNARMSCGCFSTPVQVDPDILKERGEEAFKVHGITDEEINHGPGFEQAWTRF